MKINQILASAFSVGSQWRRWDLHVHTPDSKLGSSFVGVQWHDYLDSLENEAKQAKIAVIGITDYMSIDGYEKIYQAKHDQHNPRLTSVDLLIPNIEFRALPSTKDGKALNIHLLIDPSDPEHIAKIKRALRNLKVTYIGKEGEHPYGCIRDELISYAKSQDPSITDDDQAYKFGIEQFKPSYDTILQWLKGEGWLRNNSIFGVANGKDGISGLPIDGFSATRDQILKSSHFIFSGNPNDRAYYLGERPGTSAGDIMRMYQSLKPCLHGSDAHETANLFKPDNDRFCWIKADPTFEGLRQVLWEPKCRISIGSSHPELSDSNRVIEEIVITNNNGWFTSSPIKLNPGLVAVIGEKGAGKTAIADLIAFAAGVDLDMNSQSSFVSKGRRHLANVNVELLWRSGIKSSGTLTDKPYIAPKPLVRYLSQDFVEKLCSDDHQGNELQQAIEEVVFSYLDEVHKEDYSSFEELRSARESASQSRQDHFRGQISSLHREIERLHFNIGQRPAKVATRDQINKQIEEMTKQLPSIVQAADGKTLQLLQKEEAQLKALVSEVSKKNRTKRNIDEFIRSYSDLKKAIDHQLIDLIESSQMDALLSKDQISRIKPAWDLNLENEISHLADNIEIEVSTIRGSEQHHKPDGNSIVDITKRIETLKESLSSDESNKNKLLDLQKQIATQEATSKRLSREIDEIDGKTKKLLAQRTSERNQLYLKYFEALSEDEHGLRELYAPMKQKLNDLGADKKFELSAGYRIDDHNWLEKSNRFFDGRRPAASAKKDDIEKLVVDILSPAWMSGDQQQIKAAMDEFSKVLDPAEFMEKYASPSLKLIDLLDWMYSTDHVATTYKIKYGGTSLEHLSPGTRGIALLVLYLLMDEDDRRPLIIDQPEGNLDNSSIYLQLVPYIRKAKEKRQIILVTHNPNLVVATDAEQIIVALADRTMGQSYPCISYVSGSLEHNETDGDLRGIRQTVCMLLEGGDRAFKEREGRYSIRQVS